MKRTRRSVLPFAVLTLCALLYAPALHAAPKWIITPLARKASVSGCTPTNSNTRVELGTYVVYYSSSSSLARLFCAVDTVTVPLSQVTRAVAYVNLHWSSPAASARLCYRSLTGASPVCGSFAYSTQTGVTSVVASAPSGTFDDTYVAYVEVVLPRPSYSSNALLGYELQKVSTIFP